MNEVAEAVSSQYLTFKIEGETYAVDVAGVQRVLEHSPVMKVPGAPPYMRGIMNMMGSVVPVVDLKQKFGMGQTEKTIDTCIIVLEVQSASGNTIIGALADSVDEVVELPPTSIEPAPRIGTSVNRRFLRGIGKRDDQFMMILDFDEVLGDDEFSLLATAGAAEAMNEGADDEKAGLDS